MGALLFSHFWITNVKLINENDSLLLQFENDMDVILLRFLYLACFVVSTYVIFYWVCWTLTLIWVGFLKVLFKVGWEGGGGLNYPLLSKTR